MRCLSCPRFRSNKETRTGLLLISCKSPYIGPWTYMKISARFVGYIRAGAIYGRGLYTDLSDNSGEILQKISKGLNFKHNIVKKYIARRFH